RPALATSSDRAPYDSARVETPAREEGLDARLTAPQLDERAHRVERSAATEQRAPEPLARLAVQPAVLLEPLDRVRVEHLGPDVGVVRGRVPAPEGVVEVRRAVARRHEIESDPRALEGCRLERLDVLD